MPLPQGRTYGAFAGNTPLLAGDYLLESAAGPIVACAGGGQANATPITAQTTLIGTVATAADSVMLPPATLGLELLIINKGANAVQVYGQGSDIVDDQAATTGVSQMANSLVIYTCATAGKWYTEGLSTGFATSLGLQTLAYATVAANGTDTQAAGTAITKLLNVVTSATNPGSVTLPVSQPGLAITIACATATNVVSVYPNAGGTGSETINALSANAKISMAALSSATFVCVTAGQWYTVPRVPS